MTLREVAGAAPTPLRLLSLFLLPNAAVAAAVAAVADGNAGEAPERALVVAKAGESHNGPHCSKLAAFPLLPFR